MLYSHKNGDREIEKKNIYNAWASATASKLAAGTTVGTS